MKCLHVLVIGLMVLLEGTKAAASSSRNGGAEGDSGVIRVVAATDSLIKRAARANATLRRLLEAAKPTIGVPYRWGGTRLEKGIDCSNYTWQLFRAIGRPYDRFVSTLALSNLKRSNGLQSIAFEDAEAGDLLVYGYRDESKRWHGHVVILIDKDGITTGHKGLVLGAHGSPVGSVQFVTFTGFDDEYFRKTGMRLCNVLRVDDSSAGGEHNPVRLQTRSATE